MRKVHIGVLAVVGLLWLANSQAHGQAIRGTIKSAAIDAITIEGYVISITKDTRIVHRDGTNRKAATAKDLKAGQRVEVVFNGGIEKSDPAQGEAAELVIAGDNDPDVRGVITKISKVKDLLGMVLIEEKDGKPYVVGLISCSANSSRIGAPHTARRFGTMNTQKTCG
jgi:hypothetical protein